MTDRLNLIDTIAKEDKFSTFTRLMAASGTNDIFGDSGAFTVFAPTNDAFAKLPDAKIDDLLNETDHKKLKELLSYHILPTKIDAVNLATVKTATAVSGQDLVFTDNGGIKVNKSNVQARNIEATNGVIHALDTILTAPAAAAAGVGNSIL